MASSIPSLPSLLSAPIPDLPLSFPPFQQTCASFLSALDAYVSDAKAEISGRKKERERVEKEEIEKRKGIERGIGEEGEKEKSALEGETWCSRIDYTDDRFDVFYCAEIAKEQSALTELRSHLSDLRQTLSSLTTENASLTTEVDELSLKVSNARAKHERERKELREKREEMERDVGEMESRLGVRIEGVRCLSLSLSVEFNVHLADNRTIGGGENSRPYSYPLYSIVNSNTRKRILTRSRYLQNGIHRYKKDHLFPTSRVFLD